MTSTHAVAAAPRLRLTPRGRVVFTSLAAVPLVIAAMVFALNGGGAVATGDAGSLDVVTVAAGQTLWELAEEIAPTADPRDVIADFLAVNQLGSSGLQPGQQLAVPARYSD